MRPIPEDLNLDRLIGQQLQAICIGAYDLQFRFMGDDGIRCTGSVSVEVDGRNREVFGEHLWNDPTPLTVIVGRSVLSWTIEDAYTLAISLEDGAIIRLRSQDSPYEDFILDPEVQVW